MDSKLKAVLDLGRISNLPTVWTNVLAAWLLAGGGEHLLRCFPLLVGASLIYMAGTTLNDALDASFDREHRPERPIPSGVLSEKQVWRVGLVEMGVGALILLLLAKASLVWVVALIAAILAYDFVHKKWQGSIYIMGACRLCLYFAAATTAMDSRHDVSFPVFTWGFALMAYIAGLSLVARGESTGDGTTNAQLALLAAPLIGWVISVVNFGLSIPSILTLFLFIGWVIYAFVELRRIPEDEEPDIPRFVTRLLAGIILIDAMVVSFPAGWLAIVFVGVIPFTLILQRRFAAT